MDNLKIGFLGFGQMGSAVAEGIVKKSSSNDDDNNNKNLIKKENIYFCAKTIKTNGYSQLESNRKVVETCDVIIVAVKPNVAPSVLNEVKDLLDGKLLISICAGITLNKLQTYTSDKCKIVRVMPNTACLVGESASSFCSNTFVTDEDKAIIKNLFSRCGIIEEINEKDMDIATALAGSGPAYVFLFIESLIDAGVKNGLTRDLAKKLVLKTILGSVKLAEHSNSPVQQLKDNVCSPGGTTIHALSVLEKHKFKFSVIDAVDACCEKSKSLGK